MIKIVRSSAKSPELTPLDSVQSGAWLLVESPTKAELEHVAAVCHIDIDLLLDSIDPNESPRIERDGETVYIFTRYCLPEQEKLTTAPMLIVYGHGIVALISSRPLPSPEQILGSSSVMTSKRAQLILQILSFINSGFKRRINLASRRIWQLRTQLNKEHIANEDFIAFIDIEEDLNDMLLVLEPMGGVLQTLLNGRFMRLYEEDRDLVEDLSLGTKELTILANSRLSTLRNIREAYSTITANNLNRIFKLMTSITILMSIFGTMTGIYSMNLYVPFQNRQIAFWAVMGITFSLITVAAFIFRHKRWL